MLTINVPVVDMYGAGRTDFDAGKSITGSLEGVAPENRVALKW